MCSSKRTKALLGWTAIVALVGHGCADDPPARLQLACGESHACVLRRDGSLRCWGQWVGYAETPPTRPGPFSAIAAGFFTCGLDGNGSIACWDVHGEAATRTGPFVAVTSGWQKACGLTSAGLASCWDLTGTRPGEPAPPDALSVVRAGWSGPCGLRRADQHASCWTGSPAAPPPQESLTAIAVGSAHACGIRTDGTLVCWGEPGMPSLLVPPQGEYTDLRIEWVSDCAMRIDGTIACWGSWDSPDFAGPTGAFRDFCVGQQFGCGIRPDDSIECWGVNDVGQASPPPGVSK